MHIVLFDVGGSLVQSQTVDADLYRLSLQSVFAFADISIDWSVYTNTTDTGIFHEIFSARRGRAPSPIEVERFRSHFIAAVDQEARRLPFSEVRGARAMLANLVRLPEHRIGLATGGWSASARIKLLSAAIAFDAYPSAT